MLTSLAIIAHLFCFSYLFFEKMLETEAIIVYNGKVFFLNPGS